VDHWSRFVARTRIVDLCILGYFCTAAGFCVFLFIYLVCFVFNLMVLHIYSNNEGTTLYIYITHHGHGYIIHRLIRRAWSKHITNGNSHKFDFTSSFLHFTLLNEPGNSILLSDL
jgi:hypothetical protein